MNTDRHVCLATKSRYTQNRSVAASISNSKIHRYEHTENNSVHAHQLSDDRSRISKARAAYPSTSDRDTRVLPAGIPHGGPHYIPVVYVVQHPRGPRGPWSRDTDQIVVISGDCERRKRFIGDLYERAPILLLRDRMELLYSSLFFAYSLIRLIARLSLPAGFWINFTILLKMDSGISVISRKLTEIY